ncbi:MAG TPA: beta-ketoacyl-ACP reductase [Candidatus Omnitrophota bacterium]|nr:beta-ketoacyl-ACP reductase [Candidatus Omnitrophota bacterium]
MARVVLITGGTTGIGAKTALMFKENGYQVVCNYIGNKEKAQSFSAKTGIAVYEWDVTDPDSCEAGFKKVSGDFGPVSVLVNNAGIIKDHTITKMTVEEWQSVLNVDLNACFYMARQAVPAMKEQKFGRIISLSSVNGLAGQFGQTNYAAAKAGIIGFTKSLALETARYGITANAVAPGYTDTSMMQAVPDETLQKVIDKVPVGRLAKPEEIARAILFLAHDESGFITGETLSVNGGLYMQ